MSLKVWTKQHASGSWDAGISFTFPSGEAQQYQGFIEFANTEVGALIGVANHLDGLLRDAKRLIVQLGGET